MDKDINRIPKNADTDIVIRVDDFGGKRGVTIREFVRGERYTGFTKAGTRIPVDQFLAFREAINSIDYAELIEGLGDIPPGQDKDKKKVSKKEVNEENNNSSVVDDVGEEVF